MFAAILNAKTSFLLVTLTNIVAQSNSFNSYVVMMANYNYDWLIISNSFNSYVVMMANYDYDWLIINYVVMMAKVKVFQIDVQKVKQ